MTLAWPVPSAPAGSAGTATMTLATVLFGRTGKVLARAPRPQSPPRLPDTPEAGKGLADTRDRGVRAPRSRGAHTPPRHTPTGRSRLGSRPTTPGNIAVAAAPLMACSTSITGTNNATCAGVALVGCGERAGRRRHHRRPEQQQLHDDRQSTPTATRRTTVNSSTATLTLPTGGHRALRRPVLGRRSIGRDGGAASPLTTPASYQALFKTPRSAYRTVNATTIDFGAGTNNNRYQAFINVTPRTSPRLGRARTRSATSAPAPAATATRAGRSSSPIATPRSRRAT